MKKILLVALSLISGVAFSAPLTSVYLLDSSSNVVLSGTGLCVRTGNWTPALAATDTNGCKCDKDLLPKEVCTPPVVVGVAQPTVKPVAEKLVLSSEMLFDFGKSVLKPEGKAKLDEMLVKVKAISLQVILVQGHTDRIGSAKSNQKLSDQRANSVKKYLTDAGIETNYILAEGKGETQPVTKDCKGKDVIACLQPDRRVSVEVIGTSK